MSKQTNIKSEHGKKSIFRSLFIPLIIVMIFQAAIFYLAAVYGGIQNSLSQNAADILNERLINRKNDIESTCNTTWNNFSNAEEGLTKLYASYQQQYGEKPLLVDNQTQISFLNDATDTLINTLRHNSVNGVFLILNNHAEQEPSDLSESENKYGLCIRDMDPTSNYTGTEDLLLERAPSSLVESTHCQLDSWWEAQYTFNPGEDNRFFYNPLQAAYENEDVAGEDIAYLADPHKLNGNGQEVVSFSIPLMDTTGYPYAVIGIELTTTYLASLIPGNELNGPDTSAYVFATQDVGSSDCVPIVANGALYTRCFDSSSVIRVNETMDIGGFTLTGRGDTKLFGSLIPLTVYNNNNPFEDHQLVLIGLVEYDAMFAYIGRIRQALALVACLALMLGTICILVISRRFAAPITALAKKVRSMPPEEGFNLDRLGITEIDQLVDSIENLNKNVSRNIARTEFFSRMSHDMRTPMNAIISFSSPELLEGTDEQTKNTYMEQIHTSGEYLLGLINEVLDMTKIESKKTDLTYAPVPIGHAWKTVIPIIDKLAQKKGVTFTKRIPMESKTMVLADEQHLDQIILNLLSNAVKFTPAGGEVRLLVDIAENAQNPDMLDTQIIVSDTGIGISESFMKNLYTPFEQEHEGKGGTGLGLSIAKKLVELMNGSIDCQSAKGQGTAFTIRLSFQKCTEAELTGSDDTRDTPAEVSPAVALEASDAKKDRRSILEGKRILVCEDHPMNTQIICRLLEKQGIIVTTAENGQIGLDLFQSLAPGSFDAILMDIRMPVLNGLETATAIRALDRPDAATIPILAMTANAFEEDVQASRQAGMNEHLSKPVEPQKLYAALEKYLG